MFKRMKYLTLPLLAYSIYDYNS